MSYWRLMVLIILPVFSILLESTFFSSYHFWGITPDLLLIFVVFISILDGRKAGAIYGFTCGLLLDLFLARYIGVNALSLAITGYITGIFRRLVYPEHLLAPLLAVAVGTLLNQIATFVIMYLIGASVGITQSYILGTAIQAGFNILLTIPLYIWYYKSYHQGALRP
ncbi:MAG: rod shape-determining protein MreD [Methylocystaceae bacterium]